MCKENQCQAFTLKNAQCKNKCVDNFCRVHDPKECEKREKVRRLYREIEERSYRYLKYVEREVKKSRIRHRRWVERLEKKKSIANVQCKAMTKKGSSCKLATKTDYCHVHKHLDTNSVSMLMKKNNSLLLKMILRYLLRKNCKISAVNLSFVHTMVLNLILKIWRKLMVYISPN